MNNLSNCVRLTGRLGAAPEVRELEADNKVARLSLATSFYRKNKKGDRVEETDWHQLVLWGKTAEIAERYLNKGSRVSIEGRLTNHYYTDKDGIKRFVTEVVVNELLMLDKKAS